MEEEARRAFGEGAGEFVERERRRRRRSSARKSETDGSSAEREEGGGPQLGTRGVQELAPALCGRTSGVARAREESAKRRRGADRRRGHVRRSL